MDFWLLARSGLTADEKSELELCQAQAPGGEDCYWDLNLEKYSTDSHKFIAYRALSYTASTVIQVTDEVTNEVFIHSRLPDGSTYDQTQTEHDEFKRYIFFHDEQNALTYTQVHYDLS